MEKLKSP